MERTKIKDYVINGIIESTSYDDFALEFHVLVTEDLGVPEYVKQQFGIGNMLMLVLKNNQRTNPVFDFNERLISWNTSFNQSPYTVSIPVDSVIAVVDRFTQEIVQVNNLQEQVQQQPPQTQQPQNKPDVNVNAPEFEVTTESFNPTKIEPERTKELNQKPIFSKNILKYLKVVKNNAFSWICSKVSKTNKVPPFSRESINS